MTHIWHKGQDWNLKKRIYRLERELLTRHPDKLITMPQEVKDAVQQKKLPQRCIDKLKTEHEMRMRRISVPKVDSPKRLSHG